MSSTQVGLLETT